MYFMTLKYFYKMSIFKEIIEKEIISLIKERLFILFYVFITCYRNTQIYNA